MAEQKTKSDILLERIISVVAIVMCVYQLLAANFTIFTSEQHINLHIAFSLVIIFLGAIRLRDTKSRIKSAVMIVLIALTVLTAAYIHTNSTRFQMTLGYPADKVYSGLVFLVLILVATQMTWGWVIPVIALLALAYGFFGPHMPGIFFHGGLKFERLITQVTTSFGGVYGMLASVSANTIVLFTIFGGLMEAFGAISTIMDVAMSASTKIRSGGAQEACVVDDGQTPVLHQMHVQLAAEAPTNGLLKGQKRVLRRQILSVVAPMGIAVLPQQLPEGMSPTAHRQQGEYLRQNQQNDYN